MIYETIQTIAWKILPTFGGLWLLLFLLRRIVRFRIR